MRLILIFAVLGGLLGGILGYLTLPEQKASVELPGVSLQLSADEQGLTSQELTRLALSALAGLLLGGMIGFFADRRGR
jgi:hypothetical protein